MEWTDKRLNLNEIDQNIIITKPSMIQKIWTPEIFLVNGLSASVVNALQSVQKITITRDGLINYVQRVNSELMCPMNLQNFPHDYQYCRIKISTRKSLIDNNCCGIHNVNNILIYNL